MALARGIKIQLVAFIGEYVGTFLFLFFVFDGTQTANLLVPASTGPGPQLDQLLCISLVFGFSLEVNVWVFFRVSGGLFNPAVALALCVVGVVPPLRSAFIVIAQITAGIAAATTIRGLVPSNNTIAFSVQLAHGVSTTQGFFLELFFTFELKTMATFVAPVGIRFSLFVAELFGAYWAGGALNPARTFGPVVVQRTFPGTHWVYWIGPILGALLAAAFYKVLKVLNYQDKQETKCRMKERLMQTGRATEVLTGAPEHLNARAVPNSLLGVILRTVDRVNMDLLHHLPRSPQRPELIKGHPQQHIRIDSHTYRMYMHKIEH